MRNALIYMTTSAVIVTTTLFSSASAEEKRLTCGQAVAFMEYIHNAQPQCGYEDLNFTSKAAYETIECRSYLTANESAVVKSASQGWKSDNAKFGLKKSCEMAKQFMTTLNAQAN